MTYELELDKVMNAVNELKEGSKVLVQLPDGLNSEGSRSLRKKHWRIESTRFQEWICTSAKAAKSRALRLHHW